MNNEYHDGETVTATVAHVHVKGFGFLEVAGRTARLYCHVSDCRPQSLLSIGQRVTAQVGTKRDGRPRAANVVAFLEPAPRGYIQN